MDSSQRAAFIYFLEAGHRPLLHQPLRVWEALCTNGLGFDRHFTTQCSFELTFGSVSWRLSGGRVMLLGETGSYEIGADQLVSFSQPTPGSFEFMEQYSTTVFRKTLIELLTSRP